jgi:hypothetical protein
MDVPTELAEKLKVWLDFPCSVFRVPCPAFVEVIIHRGACVYPMAGPGWPMIQ